MSPILLLSLLGCKPVSLPVGDSTDWSPNTDDSPEVVSGSDDSQPPDDSDEPEEPGDETIFTLDQVHTIEIEMTGEAWRSLDDDPYTFVQADLTFDGQLLPAVGLRIKGRLGSYRELSQKSAFKVDFNMYTPEQELRGLSQLNLNNIVQDHSYVHDTTAYEIYRAMGIPAPRVGYAWVTVNDRVFGLYALVEEYDHDFLKRWFDDPSGTFYDGDYHMFPDGSYVRVDFLDSSQQYYEQDGGEDVGRADIQAVTAAVGATYGSDRFDSQVGRVFNLDQFARYAAAELWMGQYDGYVLGANNYRVYFDPADGRGVMMPWDHDWSFYTSTPETSFYGVLMSGCWYDPVCQERFLDAIETMCSELDTDAVQLDIDRATELVQPYLADDSRGETSLNDVARYQADLRRWVNERCGEMESIFGL